MILHPAIELLIKSVNSDKPYTKENLTKWCSSLPKEEKDYFTTKIKENVSKEELIITKDQLDMIIRQSFLYQTRDVENRSEITRDIQTIIQTAVDSLNK